MGDALRNGWNGYDQILIEFAAELSGETFDTEIEWTPEPRKVEDKPHTTIDLVN